MYVAPEKADGTIGFGRDITDVSGPAQVITDGDSQVLAVCCYFKFNNNFYDREPGSVKAMISDLGWESLEQRRANTRAILMYKIAINITYSSRCKN
jgi:hypothetical protein